MIQSVDICGIIEQTERSLRVMHSKLDAFSFRITRRGATLSSMSYVRILVDGYSLLHGWPEIAPGWPRHCETARDELIAVLENYQDSIGTPVTIVFDGSGAPPNLDSPISTREMEVLFSGKGKTADDLIERVAHRLQDFGTALVVTDDFAEQNTIAGFGAVPMGCSLFVREVEEVLGRMRKAIESHNRWEKKRFRTNN